MLLSGVIGFLQDMLDRYGDMPMRVNGTGDELYQVRYSAADKCVWFEDHDIEEIVTRGEFVRRISRCAASPKWTWRGAADLVACPLTTFTDWSSGYSAPHPKLRKGILEVLEAEFKPC